ncbi:hypothetical protein BD410DRAFT_780076 [Rickenella mellea]|uniref:Ribosomal RNA-processing protein 8 n=1 Tax=Rickenella mellea TaxID=50990 RepID=A0A4R5XER3_9AGAM|nr:hypothetical protein BD410DRAFT_780076 [Rickenella mellea]
MALFDVPGWSVPSEPTPNSRKRKRPSHSNSEKVQSASVNVEKLMKKLKSGESVNGPGRRGESASGSGSKKGRALVSKSLHSKTSKDDANPLPKMGRKQKVTSRRGKPVDHRPTLEDKIGDSSTAQTENNSKASSRGQKAKKERQSHSLTSDSQPKVVDSQLTALQTSMKNSLDGARFRWINELLYKSDSLEAHQMMQDNPKAYEEYHTGFRHQVKSWPSNPVTHYISFLSTYPKGTLVVDLGCGDAALARALVPKGLHVLSFDLVSANPFIIEADICGNLPLPGDLSSDAGQVVDVVVCSLSLMSKNWVKCIREVRRVLRKGGELRIAEVASRFTDVKEFIAIISSAGFRFGSMDDRNSHFTLFDFKKSDGVTITDQQWDSLSSRGQVLQPCEYKRR